MSAGAGAEAGGDWIRGELFEVVEFYFYFMDFYLDFYPNYGILMKIY